MSSPPSPNDDSDESPSSAEPFDRPRHIRYFAHSLKSLPAAYAHLDTNRLTLCHFAVHSLDLLGVLDDDDQLETLGIRKDEIVNWIYSLQKLPSSPLADDEDENDDGQNDEPNKNRTSVESQAGGGFKGGGFLGGPGAQYETVTVDAEPSDGNDNGNSNGSNSCNSCNSCNGCNSKSKVDVASSDGNGSNGCDSIDNSNSKSKYRCLPYDGFEYDHSHVAMTYTALCTLAALGDDLSRFDRDGAIQSLKKLQLDDGSFQCIHFGSENDMRFLFCACAISHMLNDWSGVDIDRSVDFIRSCRSYDGAISLLPGQEGHGGSTFCAISALTLMGRAEDVLAEDGWRDELIRWCVSRQLGGLQGRPNKVEDTCYSYWIGGTLRLLGCDNLLDTEALTHFVLSCQTDMGGFSKVLGVYPDLLHSFYSMAWLSLSSTQGLNDLHCALGMRLEPTNVFEQFK